MDEKWVKKFESFWTGPQVVAKDWKARTKKKVIGWAIPDGPEELILASGALPMAMLGKEIPFSKADAHFQGFACSYTRGLLELLTRDELNYFDAVILPHTCDALRAFDLVAKDLDKIKITETYRPPRIRENKAAEKYLKEEIERIRKRLGEITGHYASDDEIRKASAAINKVKDLLKEMKKQLKAGRVSALEYFTAVGAAMVGEKEEIAKLLEGFLKEVGTLAPSKTGRKKVVLAGKVPEPLAIVSEIENAGFSIVDDLLVIGSRYVRSTVNLDKDPIQGLADAQVDKFPVAGMYDRDHTRGERIIKKVKANAADAVVFLVQKFCEPYEMDVVGIEEDCKKAGIPFIKLESDYQTASLAPLRTRIQAFAEMLTAPKA